MFSEVKEDEWEELGSDIAALHRLQGLSEHMFDERLMNTSTTRYDREQLLLHYSSCGYHRHWLLEALWVLPL